MEDREATFTLIYHLINQITTTVVVCPSPDYQWHSSRQLLELKRQVIAIFYFTTITGHVE